jgi:tetratricopeptide (TPR) repeat protein
MSAGKQPEELPIMGLNDSIEMTGSDELFTQGLEALARGDTLSALPLFEKALQREDRPTFSSFLALCIAKERGQLQLAVTLCEKAKAREPYNTVHYLNLGRIYLIAGKKDDAIRTFREGLGYEQDHQIIDELEKLGTRKPPLISSLKRSNPANKYLGIIFKKLGLRR